MRRSTIVGAQLACHTAVVVACVLLSIVWSGSWMPGLPLGVLAGLASSSIVGVLLRRASEKRAEQAENTRR